MLDLPVTPSSVAIAGRAAWGAGLLAVSVGMSPRPGGGGLGFLTGILGLRHLAHAGLSAGHQGKAAWRISALVDGLQAAGMLALAAHPRSSGGARAVSAIDAAIVAGFGASSYRAARKA